VVHWHWGALVACQQKDQIEIPEDMALKQHWLACLDLNVNVFGVSRLCDSKWSLLVYMHNQSKLLLLFCRPRPRLRHSPWDQVSSSLVTSDSRCSGVLRHTCKVLPQIVHCGHEGVVAFSRTKQSGSASPHNTLA